MYKKFFNIKIDNLTFIKFLFYSFPFFMLMVSGYITAYVTILTFASLFYFYSNNVKIKFDIIDFLICLLFLSSLISTFLNIKILGHFIFFKSLIDFRFLLFFLIIRNLIKFRFIDIKILFLTALFFSNFLSLDIIYQHINGQDLFGNKPFDGRFNGTFEHEAIAGSYIQKLFLFGLLFILLISLKYKFIILTFFINILGVGILLSLDRMHFLIYLFIIIILATILKKYKLIFLSNLLLILIIFFFLIKNYDPVKNRYQSLNSEINFSKINFFLKKENNKNEKINKDNDERIFKGDYIKIYKSAYYLFLDRPIMGSGVKSFETNCANLLILKNNLTCSTHPHNIYLEIIVNQGLFGFFIFLLLIIIILKNSLKEILTKNHHKKKIINIIFFTILISELWPFRSYGSIFQTVNGSMFWFIFAFITSKKYLIK